MAVSAVVHLISLAETKTETRPMWTKRFAVLALTAIGLWAAAGPACAQQVLVCFTLHNDLANFDRRAREVEHYSKQAVAAALHSSKAAAGVYEPACPPPSYWGASAAAECAARNAANLRRESEFYRLRWLERDPIRQRIIAEMARNGCPMDVPSPR